MTARLGDVPHAQLHVGGALAGARVPVATDAAALARLMLDSYAGTIDDAGETLHDAVGEVAKLLAGDFGAFDAAASLVVERDSPDGRTLASATLITRNTGSMKGPIGVGEAFLAFSMTAPAFKRQGLARAGLVATMSCLRERGEARLHLVVTRANEPALRLYESLGFVVAK
jgi:ribosomal protein S18 acetylase RimI-like enzyme